MSEDLQVIENDEDLDTANKLAQIIADEEAAKDNLEKEIVEEVDSVKADDGEKTAGESEEDDPEDSEFDDLFTNDDEAEEEESGPDEKAESLPRNVQKRIDRSTAKAKQLEEENKALRESIAKRQTVTGLSGSPAEDDIIVKDEFGNEYIDVKKAQANQARKLALKKQEEDAQTIAKTHSKVAEYSKTKPDVKENVGSVLTRLEASERPDIFMEIARQEHSAQILYLLGDPSHGEKFKELLDSDEDDVIRKVAELNTKLSIAARKKKVTKAPPAIDKVRSSGASNTSVAPEHLPMDKFTEWFKKQR